MEEKKKRTIKSTDERIAAQMELMKKLKAQKRKEIKQIIINTFSLFEKDERLLKILEDKKEDEKFQNELENHLKSFFKKYVPGIMEEESYQEEEKSEDK